MSASITFDKSTFAPTEPITGRVVVDVPPPAAVEFTAQYAVDSVSGTATGTATVGSTVTYGPVTAPGYVVTPDAVDPSRFSAVPA